MKYRAIRYLAISVFCYTASYAQAETAPPASAVPACTLADVTAAMASDPNCSLQNAVVFGADVTDFVTTQCAPFAVAPGNSEERSRKVCIQCAKDAWDAYLAAAKAKLIKARPKKQNLGQIKKLCNLNGGDKNNGDDNSESDALKSFYEQLRLCLPQDGAAPDPEACNSCALDALNAALNSGAIHQNKFNVMKASVLAVCSPHKGGDDRRTPIPSPGPGDGENSFRKYGEGLKACFDRFLTSAARDTAGCLTCVKAVDASGLDQANVERYLSHATATCRGEDRRTPTPSPTPEGTGNSFKKYGEGLRVCFDRFLSATPRDTTGCLACIKAVDANGLDPANVERYLSYATATCNGTSAGPT